MTELLAFIAGGLVSTWGWSFVVLLANAKRTD